MTAAIPQFDLSRDAFGDLVLIDARGVRHIGVTPVRLFPYSDSDEWVSLTDERSRELVLIEDLTQLPEAIRKLLQEELARREFVPVIERIMRVSGDTEPCEWDVQTDRGRTTFVLKSEDDVRRIAPHRALVIDAHGLRHLIPDTRLLDVASRRIIEQYV